MTCKHCDTNLVFDLKIYKYRCPKCGAIYTFGIEGDKMVTREWGCF